MINASKKIIYSGDRANYYKWADAMFNRGFDCSIETVMEILNVSLSWVKHTLLKEIPYVTYSYKYLYQKGFKSRVTTYIDMEDLIKWIMQASQFRRQTELVDLYSYLSLANRKKADIALKMYKDIIKSSNIGYNPGIVPEAVLQYVNREYYTNSFHVPVYYKINAFEKLKIEAPYHALTNAGHISYVELDGDPLGNLSAFEKVVRYMKEVGIGYGSINHPVDRDPECGYTGIIGDRCPRCGRTEAEHRKSTHERIPRIKVECGTVPTESEAAPAPAKKKGGSSSKK